MLVITLFEGRAKNLPIVQMTLFPFASSAQVGVNGEFKVLGSFIMACEKNPLIESLIQVLNNVHDVSDYLGLTI